MIRAVVLNVGETLVDETREYGTWADWIGVPRHAFSAVFGAVIALGMDHRDAFQYFRPGFDLAAERGKRAAGQPQTFGESDLYPDARPAMATLGDMGVWVAVAGNQTSRAGGILRNLGLPADLIATSDDWDAAKPDPAFFRAVTWAAPCGAGQILIPGRSARQRPAPREGRGHAGGIHPPGAVGLHPGTAPRPARRGGQAHHPY